MLIITPSWLLIGLKHTHTFTATRIHRLSADITQRRTSSSTLSSKHWVIIGWDEILMNTLGNSANTPIMIITNRRGRGGAWVPTKIEEKMIYDHIGKKMKAMQTRWLCWLHQRRPLSHVDASTVPVESCLQTYVYSFLPLLKPSLHLSAALLSLCDRALSLSFPPPWAVQWFKLACGPRQCLLHNGAVGGEEIENGWMQ